MQKVTLFNLFKAFFKIGLILLGGGYVIVPIMLEELKEKRGWLNEDEVCDFYCVSQCLPGIIAINMSIFVGYKLLKLKGALTSVFAMCLSPIISILIVANLIEKITSVSFIEGIFWGVNISVIVLIYLSIKDIWAKSIVNYKTFVWFLLILILSIFKVNPVILILSSIFLGILTQLIEDRKNA